VPEELRRLFVGAADVLESHRGLDYGALEVARALGGRLGVEPVTATITRLVVDLNRSPHHRNVVSQYMRSLPKPERAAAMRAYYWPYRTEVERRVAAGASAGSLVLHVAAHSFTPVLDGITRNCDIGLLYDPRRACERRFIEAWREELGAAAPSLRVRRNYPYRGTSDALVTYLRHRYGQRRYAGVELEVNQRLVGSSDWRALVTALADTCAAAVQRGV
jgi:predicted N-formylglutamate amidohydrolase